MSIDDEGFLSVMEEADPKQGAENVMAFAKALLRCAKSVTMPHNGQPTRVVRPGGVLPRPDCVESDIVDGRLLLHSALQLCV